MSSPTITAIRDALVAAIGVDHTAGGGTYDLSGADAVWEGMAQSPPAHVTASVGVSRGAWTMGGDDTTMRNYLVSATFEVWCWASSSTDAVNARLDAVELLEYDVLKAIQDDIRSTTGTIFAISGVRDATLRSIGPAVDGQALGLTAGYAVSGLEVSVSYAVNRGV